MIGRLRGQLLEKQPPWILLDVNGVGYELQVPMTTFYQLPALHQPVSLLTHLSISENAQTLYGFAHKKDRELFRILIKVSGVGPKMALGILSGMEVDELVHCVMNNDMAALVKVPGVGRKTAERLVIETRDRLQDWQQMAQPLAAMIAASEPGAAQSTSSLCEEAESALVALGYKPAQAARMVTLASREVDANSSEALIRQALKSTVSA